MMLATSVHAAQRSSPVNFQGTKSRGGRGVHTSLDQDKHLRRDLGESSREVSRIKRGERWHLRSGIADTATFIP
jgi:hypothetical protein